MTLFLSILINDASVSGMRSQSEHCTFYYGYKLVTGCILKTDKGNKKSKQLFQAFFVRLSFKILSFVDQYVTREAFGT